VVFWTGLQGCSFPWFDVSDPVKDGVQNLTHTPMAQTGMRKNNRFMKQQELGLSLGTRRTRKAVFLDEMQHVVPWAQLLALIAPHAPRAKTGRPPFELVTMLRIYFMHA